MFRSAILTLFVMPQFLFAQNNMQIEMYISQYKHIAIDEMNKFGIPASITLAQGIHESAAGTSKLALNSNNHFGIKCHKDWDGPGYKHDDDAPKECFRVYNDPTESFKDHSQFLLGRSWYKPLFALDKKDYKGWSHGLKKAGYATNPKYADVLIGLIDKYQLHQYDEVNTNIAAEANLSVEKNIAIIDTPIKIDMTNNCGQKVFINNCVTVLYNGEIPIEDLCKCENISVSQLYLFNDVDQRYSFQKGESIYLTPKKTSCEYPEYYPTKETNYREVAQRFGLQLSALLRYNDADKKDIISANQKVKLKQGTEPTKNNISTHTVVKGDTLYGIAAMYNVDVSFLRSLNNLAQSGLSIGQQLKVK
jgi:LysM repeat protein